ncbi:MAG: carbon monoxide dehydrogenase [Coriobacteriia bacterium]|nr:carbon monoxide dehydrogenase [Coriobacteriia bacterium]
MSFTIAFAGKGGTGKTTLAALAVRELTTRPGSILAVDADPNANLHEALGVDVERSVGEVTEDLMGSVDDLPPGMTKDVWMEYHIQQVLAEGPRFDVLSMGRPEGPGCYCYANTLVRRYLDMLADSYEWVVVDNEAGMEHLSRRTTRDVDALVLVSDPSVRGIRIAARLAGLADELRVCAGRKLLVVNRAREPLAPALLAEASAAGLAVTGVVPPDELIAELDLGGRPTVELPAASEAVGAVRRLVDAICDATLSSAGAPALCDGRET